MWFLLYILSYRTPVQLDFRWCSVVVAPGFSRNFQVVVGGGEHAVSLLRHLSWKPLLSP